MAKLSKPIFFAISALIVGGYLSLPAWRGASAQKRALSEAERKLEDAQVAKVAIIEDKAKFESPAGREEMARSKGMVRPRERALTIE